MKKINKTLALLLLSTQLFAQTLSPEAKVSVITVTAGDELYSGFGHTAVWIYDAANGIDKVYNYGTFDFRTDNFYWKFMRGTLPYQLTVSPMYNTMYVSQLENRSVIEQVLNLSQNQQQKLYNFLENNALPQNRDYRYKFFYDNCSTRVRDAVATACGDSLQWQKYPIEGTPYAKTYREWITYETQLTKPWSALGMSIAIGLPSDHVCTPQEEMFLPNNVMRHLYTAKIGGKKAVLTTNKLFEATKIEAPWWRGILQSQMMFLPVWIYLLLTRIPRRDAKHYSKTELWFDRIFFSVLGVMGLLFAFLWFGTDHQVTAWNLSLIVFAPTHLLLSFWLGKTERKAFVSKYATTFFGLIILLVVALVLVAIFYHNYSIITALPIVLLAWLRLQRVIFSTKNTV